MFKILQIDDLESMHFLMKAAFAERSEIRLLWADNGLEGIRLATEEKPNLILLDVNMPAMGGQEVLVRLKAESRTADIPVVVVSGTAEQDVIDAMLADGALCHLPKPFTPKALYALVESFQG